MRKGSPSLTLPKGREWQYPFVRKGSPSLTLPKGREWRNLLVRKGSPSLTLPKGREWQYPFVRKGGSVGAARRGRPNLLAGNFPHTETRSHRERQGHLIIYRAHKGGFAILRNDELLRGSVSLWEY